MNRLDYLKTMALGLAITGSCAGALWAEDAVAPESPSPASTAPESRAGAVGLSGDLGYYTYGMADVNSRFLNGREGSISGGLGFGAALKYRLTEYFTAKAGIDYLLASTASSRTISSVKYNSEVNLPATLVFLGGEYTFLPLGPLEVKMIAGYTLVTIFNGREAGTNGNTLDLGTVGGSGSGAQGGLGLELFLGRRFSVEGNLVYNFARIDGATFAGAPADPGSVSSSGVVDYSGLAAKLAFTIFLVP